MQAEKDLSVAPLMLLAWSRLGELSARFARLFVAFQQRPAWGRAHGVFWREALEAG